MRVAERDDSRDDFHRLNGLVLSDGVAEDAARASLAIGASAILDRPLLALCCSKRCPCKAILDVYDVAGALRDAEVAVVSGFHSPMEHECLELMLRGDQPVAVCPARSIERMMIPRACYQHIAGGRLVVTSLLIAIRRRPTFVAALASGVLVAHVGPDSGTERAYGEFVACDTPMALLDQQADAQVVALHARVVSVGDMVSFATHTCPGKGGSDPANRGASPPKLLAPR